MLTALGPVYTRDFGDFRCEESSRAHILLEGRPVGRFSEPLILDFSAKLFNRVRAHDYLPTHAPFPVVSEKFRLFCEARHPEVAEFFPAVILVDGTAPLGHAYWALNVTKTYCAIDVGKTSAGNIDACYFEKVVFADNLSHLPSLFRDVNCIGLVLCTEEFRRQCEVAKLALAFDDIANRSYLTVRGSTQIH